MSPASSNGASRRRRSRLHVVVSAGPTREYVDPVRFLSNESSGRMGFAIAAAAAEAGHRVTLVAGPVELPTPEGVRRVDVVSARDMLAAVRGAFQEADALIMAAAVADWRPARRLAGKWREKDKGSYRSELRLVRNPDILASVARRKGERIVIGFALETGEGLRRARAKLVRKNADFVILNGPAVLNSELAQVTILDEDGGLEHVEQASKEKIARAIVALLVRP
jgi:phosphopantothenoylcysteine decarboxylase/phosphopantothenate--cysteine ligase